MATSTVREGPFQLTLDIIRAFVTQKSPGSFILGYLDQDGNFTPREVGRATTDLRQELELQLKLHGQYNGFTFRYAASPREAFKQQCADFHECGECVGLENKKHPARPSHTNWQCPVCAEAFLEAS